MDIEEIRTFHRLTNQEIAELEGAASTTKAARIPILEMTKTDFPIPILAAKSRAPSPSAKDAVRERST